MDGDYTLKEEVLDDERDSEALEVDTVEEIIKEDNLP